MPKFTRLEITRHALAYVAAYVDADVGSLEADDPLEDLGYDSTTSSALASRLNDYLELQKKRFTGLWIRKEGRVVREVIGSAILRRLGDDLTDTAIGQLIAKAKATL